PIIRIGALFQKLLCGSEATPLDGGQEGRGALRFRIDLADMIRQETNGRCIIVIRGGEHAIVRIASTTEKKLRQWDVLAERDRVPKRRCLEVLFSKRSVIDVQTSI